MRTVVCHGCGAEIPDDVLECPSCGVETEGPTKVTASVRPEDMPASPQSAPTDKVHVPAIPARAEPQTARPSSRKMPVAKPIEPAGDDDD
jgi:hypothetical protein